MKRQHACLGLFLIAVATPLPRARTAALDLDAYVTFALNPDGSIDQMTMRAASPATDFSFDFQDLLLKPVDRATAGR